MPKPKSARAKKETAVTDPAAAEPAAAGPAAEPATAGPADAGSVVIPENTLAFPVVGIGASAGGLAAFEAFFTALSAESDPGAAFVVVQHLSPDHKSLLSELIRRYSKLPVFDVVDGLAVQKNCIYVMPPACDMALLNGTLQLLEPSAPHGHRLPIDFFFASLAHDQGERSIGIILSGTGSDGTHGSRLIKDEGGMIMIQTPGTTEFSGMPESVLASGVVDYELPAAEMPAELISFLRSGKVLQQHPQTFVIPKAESSLRKIFVLLRAQTGHDFSQYKSSTIYRRIERRMAVNQIEQLDEYVRYLQHRPPEVDCLFRDMLLGVTGFFRDVEAFKALEENAIPKIFCRKEMDGDVIRVWSTGCSTGEEAYSIAILLQEGMERLGKSFRVQLFATDIDSRAVAFARSGIYPEGISATVSPARLSRYFVQEKESGAYRIHKTIRDMVVFSVQDVIKDPPFSRLDLLICRNLLIYLNSELQKKLIPLFHFTLLPEGFLFLGTSESIGDFSNLFSAVDTKAKLYQRKQDLHFAQRAGIGRFLPPLSAPESVPLLTAGSRSARADRFSLRELTEQAFLRHMSPSCALVNNTGDILYICGHTGIYLEPAQGEAGINNILKMAREGLQRELTMALRTAVDTLAVVAVPAVQIRHREHFLTVKSTVVPVVTPALAAHDPQMFLVILEELPAAAVPAETPRQWTEGIELTDAGATIASLGEELRKNREYLQSVNEELQSTNEELQSSNEELQSTNEELETSKEEMQSMNEELITVNSELQTKVADLSRASNDMNNLLASTGIGTIFVDHNMHILRYTPTVTRIINLIPSDVGRPVAHTVSNLTGYDRMVADVQSVLDTLTPKEVDVRTTDGFWYSMRILPYRTLDNKIEGAVVTFVEITEIVRTREALQKANEQNRLAVVVRDAYDAVTVQDLDGQTLAWNPGAARMYGWTETEALTMNAVDRIPEVHRDIAREKVQQLCRALVLEPYLSQRLTKDGTVLDVSIISTALVNGKGRVYAIATTERGVYDKN